MYGNALYYCMKLIRKNVLKDASMSLFVKESKPVKTDVAVIFMHGVMDLSIWKYF